MIKIYRIVFPIVLSLYIGIDCKAQGLADTSFIATASANAIKKYDEFIEGQTGLYSGTEYRTPDRTNDQHPFFVDFDWQPGNVVYNGEFYDNINLLYDITSDVLVIEHFYNGQEVALIKAKVEKFRIGKHSFVHMNDASLLPGRWH